MDVFSIPFSRDQIHTSVLLDSLPDFIFEAWHLIEPKKLVWNWHLDAICDALKEIDLGLNDRLFINIPPGLGKSSIVNVMWTAQGWARDPAHRFLTSSYSDDITIRDNRHVRTIVTSDWFQQRFPLRLAGDHWKKKHYSTIQTGWRIATSVGGQGTGHHPNKIILDDLVKAQEALRHPEKVRAATDYLRQTCETRIALNPSIVYVGQRLRDGDPTEACMEMGWKGLVLPMRYVSKPTLRADGKPNPMDRRPDKRDIRTKDGELLFPAEWPEEKVRREEVALTSIGAAAQMQQFPVPPGGTVLKRGDFNYVDSPPHPKDVKRRCRGWDTAWTLGGGNWMVGTLLSLTNDGKIYVEHSVRDQLSPSGVDELMKDIAKMDGKSVAIREGSGSGKPVIEAHGKMFIGYDYADTPEYTNKLSKGEPFVSQVEQGNVYVVRGQWNADWLDGVCSFPFKDDDWDSTVSAFMGLAQPRKIKRKGATWGSRRKK